MPATATIDLIPYTNSNTDSTGGTKPCAEGSNGFEDVLNEVNKAYSEPQKNEIASSQNETQKVNDKAIEHPVEKPEKTSGKNEDKNPTEKITDKDDSVKDSKENSPADKVKEKAETAEKEEKTEKIEKSEKADTNGNIENKTSDKNTVIVKEEIENKENRCEDANIHRSEEEPPIQVSENPALLLLPPAEEKKLLGQEITDSTNKQNIEKITAAQNDSQIVQNDFNVDLSNLTGNLGEITENKSNNVKAQIQQALPEIKINKQEVSSEAQAPETLQPKIQQQQISAETIILKETNIQTPVIEAKADIVASNININSSLANTNKGNNKCEIGNGEQINSNGTSLTQEVLDKTNAQVINVEASNLSNQDSSNTNSSQNNVLNKQNVQEQAVKLELENNSNKITTQSDKQDIDLTYTADANIQTSADTMENIQAATPVTQAGPQATNVQTLTTQAVQTPKELSQSDILSQINGQLDIKKLQEEGITKVNIVLKPENLGKINLELVNSKEGLTAKMTTDNAQVKELLTKSLDSLKDSLSSQGVNINNVTVKIEETQKQSNDMFSFDDRQPQGEQEGFSNNAQNQNQSEFLFDEKGERIIAENEAKINAETDIEIEEVSVSQDLTRVDYKV